MKTELILFILFLPWISQSQDSNLGNWLIYFGNKKIDAKWNWHHEVQYRNYNAIGDLEQLLIRTGIGYNLAENNNNILLGYGFIHSQNYLPNSADKIEIDEHRIFQQFITRQKFGRFNIQHRYRFEQRFIDRDFRLRLRYFLACTVALTRNELTGNTLYLSGYNEIFLNTNNTKFDRNRLYGGIGYKFNNHVQLEAGYMVQYLDSRARDQVNLIAFVAF